MGELALGFEKMVSLWILRESGFQGCDWQAKFKLQLGPTEIVFALIGRLKINCIGS